MKHPDTTDLFSFLFDQNECQAIESHIDDCPHCQQRLDLISQKKVEEFEQAIAGEVESPAMTDWSAVDLSDRYEFVEKIGSGGMGEVFRCNDLWLHRQVAIKVIGNDLNGMASMRNRFRQEARTCALLEHPGIVPIHDLGQLKNGRSYLSMKLVEGDSLQELLNHRHDSSESASYDLLQVFHQICQTMAFVHNKDFVHQDLKPGNILIGEFGEALITDWGIAKKIVSSPSPASTEYHDHPFESSNKEAGVVMGTAAFMAPEQFQLNQELVDKRSDVYALGTILVESLLLQRAFPDPLPTEDDRQKRTRELIGLLEDQGTSEELLTIVSDCLEIEPQSRPVDASVLADQMGQYFLKKEERLKRAELLRIQAETKHSVEIRKRRTVMVLSLVLVISIVMFSSILIYQSYQSRKRDQEFVERALVQFILPAEKLLAEIETEQPPSNSQIEQVSKLTSSGKLVAQFELVDDYRSRVDLAKEALEKIDSDWRTCSQFIDKFDAAYSRFEAHTKPGSEKARRESGDKGKVPYGSILSEVEAAFALIGLTREVDLENAAKWVEKHHFSAGISVRLAKWNFIHVWSIRDSQQKLPFESDPWVFGLCRILRPDWQVTQLMSCLDKDRDEGAKLFVSRLKKIDKFETALAVRIAFTLHQYYFMRGGVRNGAERIEMILGVRDQFQRDRFIQYKLAEFAIKGFRKKTERAGNRNWSPRFSVDIDPYVQILYCRILAGEFDDALLKHLEDLAAIEETPVARGLLDHINENGKF